MITVICEHPFTAAACFQCGFFCSAGMVAVLLRAGNQTRSRSRSVGKDAREAPDFNEILAEVRGSPRGSQAACRQAEPVGCSFHRLKLRSLFEKRCGEKIRNEGGFDRSVDMGIGVRGRESVHIPLHCQAV